MEMKRYTDIERLKDKYREVFTKGELITITEKVDGSNASIRYDEETDSLAGFSRNRQVSVKDGLQGFFDFVQTRSKGDFKAVLGTRYIIFGEWLDNKFSGTPAYVKIVSESFSETKAHKTKKTDTERSEEYLADLQLAQTIVTKRRVEKLLQKFVESGELPENFDEHQLKEISRILPKACYDDCMKEEPETAVKIKEFGKLCSKLCMQYAKQVIFGE